MNKIKTLYDVVSTMKEKKERQGILQIKIERDGQQEFYFTNDFHHDSNGNTKLKLRTEWNYNGNEGKHESTTEFKRGSQGECPFQNKLKNCRKRENIGGNCGPGFVFKSKIETFLFFLRVLNELKVEEQEGKIVFSLELDEEVKKIKERLQVKFGKNEMIQESSLPFNRKIMKEIISMDEPSIVVKVIANNSKEVEKVTISIQGSCKQEAIHMKNIEVEINFTK